MPLTDLQRDAIGYLGGGVLAICLVPQVAKVVLTRSARDISILWSLLYTTGLSLSLAYLVLKDAPAAWIPLIFEICGCVGVLCLKLFFEHTAAGRRFSAARAQPDPRQQLQLGGSAGAGAAPELCLGGNPLLLPLAAAQAAPGGSKPGLALAPPPPPHPHPHAALRWRSHSWHDGTPGLHARLHDLGHAVAAAAAHSDISWRGSAVLGTAQHQAGCGGPPMLSPSPSRHGSQQLPHIDEQPAPRAPLAGPARGGSTSSEGSSKHGAPALDGAAIEVQCCCSSNDSSRPGCRGSGDAGGGGVCGSGTAVGASMRLAPAQPAQPRGSGSGSRSRSRAGGGGAAAPEPLPQLLLQPSQEDPLFGADWKGLQPVPPLQHAPQQQAQEQAQQQAQMQQAQTQQAQTQQAQAQAQQAPPQQAPPQGGASPARRQDSVA